MGTRIIVDHEACTAGEWVSSTTQVQDMAVSIACVTTHLNLADLDPRLPL